MIKILFIDTPYNVASRREPSRVYLPMAALYLATALKKSDVESIIFDPKLFAQTIEKDGVFYRGASNEMIAEKISEASPDIVCVTNLLSKDMNNAIEICRISKHTNANALTVVGGVHATLFPEDFLSDVSVDMVARGEGEETIKEIVDWRLGNQSLSDIAGVSYRHVDGTMVSNSDRKPIAEMSAIGFPDYSLINLEEYFELWNNGKGPRPLRIGNRTLPVFTSRGCQYHCYFCAAHHIVGRRFRPCKAQDVISHIKELIDSYQIDSITFEDDNMSANRKRFEEIVDGILELPRKISWSTPNGIRADTLLDVKLLQKVRESGCRYMIMGVESGDQDFLNRVVKKALNLDHVTKLAELCQSISLPLFAYFIVGFPGETRKQVQKTLDFAETLNRKYSVFPYISYAIPLRGTELYEESKSQHLLVEEVNFRSLVQTMSVHGESKIKSSEFTFYELTRLIKNTNRRVLCNHLSNILLKPVLGYRIVRLSLFNLFAIKRLFL